MTGKHTLCELAQSKCTWTVHKSHFVLKCTGNWPDTDENTSIKHRALTATVRTPQCGHTVWGMIKIWIYQLQIHQKVLTEKSNVGRTGSQGVGCLQDAALGCDGHGGAGLRNGDVTHLRVRKMAFLIPENVKTCWKFTIFIMGFYGTI